MRFVGKIPLASLEGGALVRVPYPPFDVLVALVDGQPRAIEDACNHAGASLAEGHLEGDCISCPMHGYVFSMRTGALLRPLGLCDAQRTFEVRREGDDVTIWDAFSVEIVK